MTFYEWMMAQVGRNDEIGDLAGDMKTDILLAKDDPALVDMSVKYWQARIKRQTDDGLVLVALYRAAKEYESGQVN